MQRLIITIDGPAGSGKSTVARLLAARLGLAFLDTGAMYRGLTAHCLDRGIDPASQSEQVVRLARQSRIHFDWEADPPRLHIDDRDLTTRLRDSDTTAGVSDVASIGPVRDLLVEAQRSIGLRHQCLVTEGRDQGSIVFPDADAKFYIDASPQVRARRRADELREGGRDVDEDRIRQQILVRDRRDAQRSDGPLICPADAQRIDTSAMTLDAVVDHMERHVRLKASDAPGGGDAATQRRSNEATKGLGFDSSE